MANTIKNSANSLLITINGLPYTADLTTTLTMSGSASIAQSVLVTSGSTWTAIDTGSVTNVGKLFLDNPAGPGTILWATSSNTAVSNPAFVTGPSEWVWASITGSGMANGTYPLYARALDTQSYVNVIVLPR